MNSTSITRRLSLFVAFLLVAATFGFVVIEGWPVADSVYMTVITLSTVGFGEVQELTPKGRMYTSVLIAISSVLMAGWTAGITSFLVSGQLTGRFQRQRDRKMISRMQDHVVVCGGGITALTVIAKLVGEGKQVVAIASATSEIEAIRQISPEIPVVEEDAKSELAMMDANILHAKYLVAATESDYDNLLVVITGKGMGTNIRVISFAHSTELASRMFKTGADDVVCPLVIGGEHVASLISDESHTANKKTVPAF
ncbi:potassium channel family protein [Stieleria varia]|uniref:Voltage-gated potassium channel Kch n=1 Tax=Stieleria varia TaxID=2528005 RepID=A0A5C6AVL2_9BACT|nr:potassium channel family protein [Stieleria varia]TWU02164.1 Voltage-gated potassium channel Kch [Stieleria varia]